MKPFMGLLGLSVSLVFLAGDIGGDIMDPVPPEDLTEATAADGSKLAIPCRSVKPPGSLLIFGENWSVIS